MNKREKWKIGGEREGMESDIRPRRRERERKEREKRRIREGERN